MIIRKIKEKKSQIAKEGITGFTLICNHFEILCFVFVICIILSGTVSASAELLWQTIAGLVGTWVTRLGAVVMFVGGIMFGLGWKNDDAEGKSRGISTLIAGAIVVGVAQLTSTFFA